MCPEPVEGHTLGASTSSARMDDYALRSAAVINRVRRDRWLDALYTARGKSLDEAIDLITLTCDELSANPGT
jgi:hypothetical protein